MELSTYELNPASLWSHLLNEKVFPSFKKEIPDLEIEENANEFYFIFKNDRFQIEFSWNKNKLFTTTLFVKTTKSPNLIEITINGYVKKEITLDTMIPNSKDGQYFCQIIDFLTKGNINLLDPLLLKEK